MAVDIQIADRIPPASVSGGIDVGQSHRIGGV
jgi:hypothetical protein